MRLQVCVLLQSGLGLCKIVQGNPLFIDVVDGVDKKPERRVWWWCRFGVKMKHFLNLEERHHLNPDWEKNDREQTPGFGGSPGFVLLSKHWVWQSSSRMLQRFSFPYLHSLNTLLLLTPASYNVLLLSIIILIAWKGRERQERAADGPLHMSHWWGGNSVSLNHRP